VDRQLLVFAEVIKKELSAKETDALIKANYKSKATGKKTKTGGLSPQLKKIEDNLASAFGTRVRLTYSSKGSGTVTFEYYSLEEFNGLLEKLNARVHS
jgi:ParB family chromosome partitioning protein